MFSAVRQQQNLTQETNPDTDDKGYEIEDGCKPEQSNLETKQDDNAVVADDSKAHARQERLSESNCLTLRASSDKKKTRRVVSESALQSKVG